MAGNIYKEENGVYQIDFSSALWSTDELHDIFHKSGSSLLSDVDFVAETDNEIILVEYKNANIGRAKNPDAFIPSSENRILKIAYKFYDSIIYICACGYKKPYKYVYVLEYPKGDSTTRKLIRNKIAAKLPFELQKDKNIKHQLINGFEVLSIDEWNNNPLYSIFPISIITTTNI